MIQVSIEEDGKYYRVVLIYDTHRLHSEKLNLRTALKLFNQFDGIVRI